MVNGPRQSGKTTLVRNVSSVKRAYFTLDDAATLKAAREDPTGFVREIDKATIDEVQHAPDLLPAIKMSVDKDRRPGRFLLTGSANIMTVPRVSESLAGRMEVVTLLPLSRAEVLGHEPTFLKKAFTGKIGAPAEPILGKQLVQVALRGGYPEMLTRKAPERRRAWAQAYIRAIVQRDIREIGSFEKLERVPRLLRVLALHSGHLTNFTQIGGQIGFDDKTTRIYVAALDHLYLVRRLEPWFRNRLNRLLKTPKLHFLDSGLLAALLGLNEARIAANRKLLGPLLETYVFSEILKQATWPGDGYSLHHYRDRDGDEVDLVAENEMGEVVGMEVKAAATVGPGDFKGLRKLADAAQKDFKLGVVFYDGDLILPFGERMFAAPMSCAWG